MKILIVLLTLLIPSLSYASPINLSFQGNVTSTYVHPIFGGSEYASQFAIDDEWRINLTIDTNTINLCSYSGQEGGVYSFSNMGTASIGSHNFTLRSGALEMNTQDGNCGTGLSGAGAMFRFMTVTWDGLSNPQPPIEGAAWLTYPGYNIPTSLENLHGSLSMRIGMASIGGTFNNVVPELRTIPEPSSLILLTIGLVYGIKSARRHRN